MTMTMDELMKVLDMQEDILQFTHFTNADAWELGTMILMEARRRGAQVGIMIRRSNRKLYSSIVITALRRTMWS